MLTPTPPAARDEDKRTGLSNQQVAAAIAIREKNLKDRERERDRGDRVAERVDPGAEGQQPEVPVPQGGPRAAGRSRHRTLSTRPSSQTASSDSYTVPSAPTVIAVAPCGIVIPGWT